MNGKNEENCEPKPLQKGTANSGVENILKTVSFSNGKVNGLTVLTYNCSKNTV